MLEGWDATLLVMHYLLHIHDWVPEEGGSPAFISGEDGGAFVPVSTPNVQQQSTIRAAARLFAILVVRKCCYDDRVLELNGKLISGGSLSQSGGYSDIRISGYPDINKDTDMPTLHCSHYESWWTRRQQDGRVPAVANPFRSGPVWFRSRASS